MKRQSLNMYTFKDGVVMKDGHVIATFIDDGMAQLFVELIDNEFRIAFDRGIKELDDYITDIVNANAKDKNNTHASQ